MLSNTAATGPPTMVTKDTVLSRHHHLTLFWKYSAHRGRWALSKIREGGKQRTKLPLLNVMIICLEYPGKQLTCYYQKKKKKTPNLKNLERCLVIEKQRQFIERTHEHLKRWLIRDMSILVTRSHFGCTKLAKIKTSNNTNDGKAK